ncbi:UNKNOWN [Stylonychia lemnae]|uniref:Uncharacterized protein n=1 Tax=Stylonychia lemnae TaxID=5949 RepID=A0A078B4G8_STYLE|nr:UNKNOWN [Stylonychia lemnae]|eukprot:CDW89166.1 UNKNOWN [Stylonychia lemnae]
MKALKMMTVCTIAFACQLSNAQLVLPTGLELQRLLRYGLQPQVIVYPDVEAVQTMRNREQRTDIIPKQWYIDHYAGIVAPIVMASNSVDAITKTQKAVDFLLTRNYFNSDQIKFLTEMKNECVQDMKMSAQQISLTFPQRFENLVAQHSTGINSDQRLSTLVEKVRDQIKQSMTTAQVYEPNVSAIDLLPYQYRFAELYGQH